MLLYQLRDLQFAALAPWHFAALASESILNAPFCPFSHMPIGQKLAENAKIFGNGTRFYAKPDFNITQTKFRGEMINVRERLIDFSPFCRLISFVRASPNPSVTERAKKDPSVLLIAPFSGYFASILRGTVEALLPAHNVFVTDWTDARMIPLAFGPFDLDAQIKTIISFLRQLGDDLHIVALGQACAPALAAVALLAEDDAPLEPRSLTLLGGAIDTQIVTSALSEVARSHPLSWFKETRIQLVPPYYPGAWRAVYPGFMNLRHRLTVASEKSFTEQAKYFEYLSAGCEETGETLTALYDSFLSVMDVPAELFLDYVKQLYQENALARGVFVWRGRKVNLGTIKNTALLTIEGEMDDLAPPGQVRAAQDLCASIPLRMKQAHLEIGVGSFGLFTGRKWRNNVEPVIHKFIRQHSMAAQEVEKAIG